MRKILLLQLRSCLYNFTRYGSKTTVACPKMIKATLAAAKGFQKHPLQDTNHTLDFSSWLKETAWIPSTSVTVDYWATKNTNLAELDAIG